MAYKRKRVYAPKRSAGKKRRFARRRPRRSAGLTSKSGIGQSNGFRAKKISRRRWKKMLWDSTLMLTHYRSNNARYVALTTDVTAATGTMNAQSALRFGGNNFYVAAGGLQPQLTGTASPVFEGDKVLRGGTIGVRFYNNATDNTIIYVNCFLVKSNVDFLAAALPAFVITGWDPSIIPDFKQRVGTILMNRKFQLENANSSELTYRMPIQKIEDQQYVQDRSTYLWLFVLSNSINGVVTCDTTFFYNLSFTADATT